MEKKYICFSAALLVFFMYGLVHPQTERGKIGIGLDVGAQRIFGDKKEKEGIGFGGEGFVTYKILPFADIGLNLGYGQLNYEYLFPVVGTVKATTNLINVDLKSNLEVVSKGSFRPYLTLGAGIANFGIEDSGLDRKNVASFFGGGGVRYTVNPRVNLFLGGDYRFLDTDGLDGFAAGKAKDGYLNIRTGLSYQVGNQEETPDVIAEERAPFVEVEDSSNYYEPQQKAPGTSGATGNETKDMEEYVRLKSKIDQLSGNVDSKEKEISELQRRLNDQKQRVSTMANKASTKPSVDLQKSSSMSSFSDIYEEA